MEKEQKQSEEMTLDSATTVGSFLKYMRLKQKKSVEDVAESLYIRKIYIRAIEEDNFAELPPIPYGVGFVRSYAAYLGLNVERIVQFYKNQVLPKKDKPISTIVKQHSRVTMPSKHQIYIGLAAILCLYVLFMGVRYFSLGKAEPAEDVQTSEVVVEEAVEANDNVRFSDGEFIEENNKSAAPTESEAQEQSVRPTIVAKFKGRSWFELKDNNQVYLSGTFDKDFEYQLPDVEGLIVSVGRYYNVAFFVNGEQVQIAGPKRQYNVNIDEVLAH